VTASGGPARARDAPAHLPRVFRVALAATAVAASVAVVVLYAAHALELLRYPWDWLPDEGLSLDFASRVARAPGTLYPRGTVVPFPAAYGPVLPVLLAPVVALGDRPLLGARALALTWTAAGVLLVYLLARRGAPVPGALAAAALALSPFSMTFWHLLVRPDGLMLSLWLAAALALLPRDLRRGADALGPRRLWAGTACVLLAVLTKPTAGVLCVPLVLGWALVDRRTFWRLAASLAVTGATVVGLLQWATGGGFLHALAVWRVHPIEPGAFQAHALEFARGAAPVLLLWLVLVAVAAMRGRRPLRDPSVLLVAGGLLAAPAMAKHGALWSYLLPALAAIAVMCGRLTSGRPARSRPDWLATAAAGGVALGLALSRPFPTPTPLDARTSAAFFSYVETAVRNGAAPILASKPEYAYWTAGQPSEIESVSFFWLARAGAPGTRTVFDGLRRGRYGLVVDQFPVPLPAYTEPLRQRYRVLGGCALGYYFGPAPTRLWLRSDLDIPFRPPADTRCTAAR
jgi:Dolichyl-phosphate-mannose-protein mannosyltransferase